MAVRQVNPKADVIRKGMALNANINAAVGLQDVMKSNLGPRGTLKMLVSGGGDIKLTKDGSVLINEMQIQHPTAQLIARTAGAQDEATGDGTTTNILLTGELMKACTRYIREGLHPRIVTEGYLLGKQKALEVLDSMRKPSSAADKELLYAVTKTVIGTKVRASLAAQLAKDIVDAVLLVYGGDDTRPIDLFMVEIMHMIHREDADTHLVRGLVMDHGSRHPDMPKRVEDAYIMTMNVSLEYEKTEVNSSFFYSSVEQRAKMVEGERKFTDDRVKKIIEFKRKIVGDSKKGFVIINQKGIDPLSLDMLAKENILALRRAKRRNMERVCLACGGIAINSVEELSPDCLGWAGLVYEQTLGEDKYTFVEDVKHPKSCTMLIKGPNDYTISQIKEAIRDGLRAVKNAIEDKAVLPGAGAFELVANYKVHEYAGTLTGRVRLAVEAYAESLLVVPKTLAENSGFDVQDTLLKLQDETRKGHVVGIDVVTGDPIDPVLDGLWDCYRVKRQLLNSSAMNASQLLLVDEVLRAGKKLGKQGGDESQPVQAPGE